MEVDNSVTKQQRLRQLLAGAEALMVPGCYDCITARMIHRAGFQAAYLTGSGISLTTLGHPDINTVSYVELRNVVQNISQAVDLPLIVDIDTGFGGPLNIIRLVRDFENLDVAAVQIEDQAAPKKCGHELGRVLVPIESMCHRLQAIQDTRKEADGMVIVARTDAITDYGVDEAILRANAYLKAGADIIFVESPETMEQIERITAEVQGAVLFNNVEGGRSPFLSRKQLNQLGICAAIYPNMLTRVITKSCLDVLGELKEHGTTENVWDRMIPHKDLWPLFDSEAWYKTEKKYQ